MNYVKHFERCPRCAKLGNDTSHDNLASYSDDSKYCFACSYFVPSDKTKAFRAKDVRSDGAEQRPVSVTLPADVETSYPHRAIEWIEQYELSRNDLLRHNVLWSEEWQRLIFPYFIDGELLAWQGRSFASTPDGQKPPAKWFSKGKLHEFIYVIFPPNSGEKQRSVVITEDVVSAIKVSRYLPALPIFGSVIGTKTWSRLTKFFDNVIIFLDPDMRARSVKEAKIGQMFGINTKVVISDHDPKEIPYQQLQEILNG